MRSFSTVKAPARSFTDKISHGSQEGAYTR
jgi:hypothetical protein